MPPLKVDIKMIDYLMIDYHFKDKDNLNLSILEPTKEDYNSGWIWFVLRGKEPIKIGLNERLKILRFRANFMYFIQGHNYSFNLNGFLSVVEWLNGELNVNLWEGSVEELEVCVIIEVEVSPQDYIKNHKAPRDYKQGYDFGSSKCFIKGKAKRKESAELYLKLYDVRNNLKNKCKGLNGELIGMKGDKHYIKFEIHYNKPHKYLNDGRDLLLRELFTEKIQMRLQEEIKNYYNQVKRDFVIIPPESRGDLGTSTILAIYGMEKAINNGLSLLETKREIYYKINHIPAFTQKDKDNRKREVKKVLQKLERGADDRWDLSEKISEKLEEDGILILFNNRE